MNEKENTIKYYDENAESFKLDTLNADMHEMQDWFLSFVPEHGRILDLGCGTGRDTKYFIEKEYIVSAVDGSKEMCKIASANTGLDVRHLLFEDLDYIDCFDGVWACASLLHASMDELPAIIERIGRSLKADGIFYASFKKGTYQGDRNGRYYTDLTEETFTDLLKKTGMFSVLEFRESFDVRPGRENEAWINVIAKI